MISLCKIINKVYKINISNDSILSIISVEINESNNFKIICNICNQKICVCNFCKECSTLKKYSKPIKINNTLLSCNQLQCKCICYRFNCCYCLNFKEKCICNQNFDWCDFCLNKIQKNIKKIY